jgi:hypothetical protein
MKRSEVPVWSGSDASLRRTDDARNDDDDVCDDDDDDARDAKSGDARGTPSPLCGFWSWFISVCSQSSSSSSSACAANATWRLVAKALVFVR